MRLEFKTRTGRNRKFTLYSSWEAILITDLLFLQVKFLNNDDMIKAIVGAYL